MKKRKKNWIKIRALQALNPAPIAGRAEFKNMPTNRGLSVSARNTWMVLRSRWNPSGLPDAKCVAELSGQTAQAVERDIRQLRQRGYIRHTLPGEKYREPGEEFKMRGEVCCWPVARREWPGVYRRPNLYGED
jgi:hypothetical protein